MFHEEPTIVQIIFDNGRAVKVRDLSFDDWRRFMGEFLQRNPNAGAAWDLMGCVRGPDFPSERPDMRSSEHDAAYKGRRKRKYETVEVIRNAMFFGFVGGGARSHSGDSVELPPTNMWDHFDRHVARGANAVGLKVNKGTASVKQIAKVGEDEDY